MGVPLELGRLHHTHLNAMVASIAMGWPARPRTYTPVTNICQAVAALEHVCGEEWDWGVAWHKGAYVASTFHPTTGQRGIGSGYTVAHALCSMAVSLAERLEAQSDPG